ncbi:MAG TPA: maleylpyruvate isomerase family mycothiol-dependent enzyme [Actinoplanes sp.]|nr:maleylpyruvate isomerase family mycothiol-dependent enzyme [Actinoplanes sp.]
MDEAYWSAVRTMRLHVADFLAELSPAEWDAASLCQGWRVRDVAGHLALVPTITTWDLLAAAPRGRFNLHHINTVLAIRHGSAPPDAIMAKIRRHAGDRTTARMLDPRDGLFDVIVHSQDIARPLGRDFPVPPEYSRRGLQRVWEMGWPFRARRRFAGLSLRADDADWTVGTGPEVTGPALALLLLLTGRRHAAMDALQGTGVGALHG